MYTCIHTHIYIPLVSTKVPLPALFPSLHSPSNLPPSSYSRIPGPLIFPSTRRPVYVPVFFDSCTSCHCFHNFFLKKLCQSSSTLALSAILKQYFQSLSLSLSLHEENVSEACTTLDSCICAYSSIIMVKCMLQKNKMHKAKMPIQLRIGSEV